MNKKILSFVITLSLIFSNFSFAFADTTLNREVKEEKSKYANVLEDSKNDDKLVEKSFIIEFKEENRDKVKQKLKSIDGVEINYEYSLVLNGLSAKIELGSIDKVLKIAEITNIQESFPVEPATFNAKKLSKVIEAMENTNFQGKNYGFDGRGMVIATIDSGVDTAHKDLRLDDDAKDFVKIKNITKGGNFTLKVPHGFNYVEGNRNVKDDFVWAHGQHIAGILAGCASVEDAEKGLGVRGVAPNAQILAYKIFTDKRDDDGFMGSSGDDSVYHAMEDAIKHGADVISLSIGEPGFGRRGDLYGSAIENAKKNGVIVCVSMGNYGALSSENTYDNNSTEMLGMKDTSIIVSGAANKNGIGVGAAKNTKNFMDSFVLDGKSYPFAPIRDRIFELAPKDEKSYDFVFLGRGLDEDYDGIDANGKIVVALRGAESVWDKIERANVKGATGFILVNDITHKTRDTYLTEFPNYFEYMNDFSNGDKIWAIGVNGNIGRELFDIPESLEERIVPRKEVMNRSFYVSDEKVETVVGDDITVSGFSSWGPNVMLELKPDVVAPGQEIVSTGIVKDSKDTYVRMSGTSMSTPHVAGISTLLLSKVKADMQSLIDNEEFDKVDLVKHLMMNTAKPLNDANGIETSPRQQGAGFVDTNAAFSNNVIVSYSKMPSVSLKEIPYSVDESEFELTLYNFGDKSEEFDISFSGILTDEIVQVKKINEDYSESYEGEIHPKELENCSINSDKDSVIVEPNSKAKVMITLNTRAADEGFVEGFVYFTPKDSSTNQPRLVVPYMGYKGDFGKENIIDPPAWEENSKTKLTSLMTGVSSSTGEQIYEEMGKDENGNINPDMIAMSNEVHYPGVISVIVPRIIALRDAVDYEVSLVNEKSEDAESIYVFAKGNVFKKFINSYYIERDWYKSIAESPDFTMEWKGYLFNNQYNGITEDGLYAPRTAQEGQYYIRLKFRNSMDKDYQLTYMPLKIDNTKPEVEKVEYIEDKSELKISFNENFGMHVPEVTLDSKKLNNVQRIDKNNFVVKDVKLNILSENRVVIKATDYANIPCTLTKSISEKLFKFKNLSAIKKSSNVNMTLKGEFLSEKVDTIIANLNDNDMNVSIDGNKFEIALNGIEDKNTLKLEFRKGSQIIAKHEEKIYRDSKPPVFEFDVDYDINGKVRVDNFGNYEIKGKLTDDISDSENIKLFYSYNVFDRKTIKKAKVGKDSKFSIKVNVDKYPVIYVYAVDESGNKTDKLANHFNPQQYYSGGNSHSVNGKVVARHGAFANGNDVIYPKHPWLMVTSDSIMHDGSLASGGNEDAFTKVVVRGKKGQKLEVRSYNPEKNGYKPIKNADGYGAVQTFYYEQDDELSDIYARLLYGFNCVNVRLYDSNDNIVLDRGYTFFVDLKSPELEFYNVSPYEYNGSMVDGYDGIFYAKSEKFDIEGAIDDDSYEMSVFINDSEVTRWSLFGEMNQKRRFVHTHKGKDGDFIRIKAADVAGYEEEFSYKLVIDDIAPTVELSSNDNYSDESTLEVVVKDEISGGRVADKSYVETTVTVNGKLYQKGDMLKNYKTKNDSGYYIVVRAIDRAGNVTIVDKKVNVKDSNIDKVALKEQIAKSERFTKVDELLELNGFVGKYDFVEFAPYYESRSDDELEKLGYVNLDSINPYKIIDKIEPLQAKEFTFFVRFEDDNGVITIKEFEVNRGAKKDKNSNIEVIVYSENGESKIIPSYGDKNLRYRVSALIGNKYGEYNDILDFIKFKFENGSKSAKERNIESMFIRKPVNFGVPEDQKYNSLEDLKKAIIDGGEKNIEYIFVKIK